MAPGRDQITTIDVSCVPGVFQAKGKVTLFDGWRKLTGGDATEESKKKEGDDEDADDELPMLNPGDVLGLLELAALKRATKPPPRFTQASLIKRLEHDGIGRPSTYAAIMRVIMERGYVKEEKRKLHATELGISVTDFLVSHYAGNFIDMDYTARLEDDLDRIARGEAGWEKVVTEASFAVIALARKAGLWYDPLVPRPAKPSAAAHQADDQHDGKRSPRSHIGAAAADASRRLEFHVFLPSALSATYPWTIVP